MTKNKLDQSISQLEGWKWRDITSKKRGSNIEERFHQLHNKPISKLKISEIRFLIGQNAGLEYLVPISLSKLKKNLFLETEYYPGDLLCSLFQINNEPNYWKSHKAEKQQLIELYTEKKGELDKLNLDENLTIRIKNLYNDFLLDRKQKFTLDWL